MPEIATIPLGGVDVSGRALPATGQYIAPGGVAGVSSALGNWEPYVPPQQAPGSLPIPQQAGPMGNWEPYVAPAQAPYVPPRTVSPEEALTTGAAHGFTFGAAPMISGLSAASGMQIPQDTGNPIIDAYNAARQLASPLVGAYNLATEPQTLSSQITGETPTQKAYREARDQALKDYQETQRQHPYLTTAGEIGGGAAATPFLGSTLGGLKAANVLGRIGQSAKVGAVTGGLFGAGEAGSRGETPGQVALEAGKGAVAGGVAGGALGGTIEGVAGTIRKAASIARGATDPAAEAARRVAEMFKGQGQRPLQRALADTGMARARIESGAPVALADYGGRPAGRMLRTAANLSPEAGDLMDQQLNERFSDQSNRVVNWIQQKFGGADTAALRDRLKDLARQWNRPAYQRAYQEGDREIASNELERIMDAPYVQTALRKAIAGWKNQAIDDGFGAMNPTVRIMNGQLVNSGTGLKAFPNVQLWDYIARNLSYAADRAPPGGNEQRLLANYARNIKKEVDAQVPSFQAAREGASRFFGAQDALEAGRNFVSDNTITNPEAAREIAKMNPAERKLFAQGFAGELQRIVSKTGDNRNVAINNIFNSRNAKQRLDIALGPNASDEFGSLMRLENLMEKTRRAALLNSTTAGQLTDIAKSLGLFEIAHSLNPAYVLAGALTLAGRQAARKIDEEVFMKVAEMLLSDDPKVLQRGLQIVTKNPAISDAFRRAGDLSVRELMSIAGPSNVLAGAATAARIPGLRPQEEPTPKAYNPQEQDQGTQGMVGQQSP